MKPKTIKRNKFLYIVETRLGVDPYLPPSWMRADIARLVLIDRTQWMLELLFMRLAKTLMYVTTFISLMFVVSGVWKETYVYSEWIIALFVLMVISFFLSKLMTRISLRHGEDGVVTPRGVVHVPHPLADDTRIVLFSLFGLEFIFVKKISFLDNI